MENYAHVSAELAEDFVAIFADGMTSLHLGPSMTCTEAETFAAVLSALGGDDRLGKAWIKWHATGDDDENDMHHDLYLESASAEEIAEEFRRIVQRIEEDPMPELTDRAESVIEGKSLPYTVAVSGSERHDGERGYLWVLMAPDKLTAAARALSYHREVYSEGEDNDLELNGVDQGVPRPFEETGDAWNDLRGDSVPEPTEGDWARARAFLAE